MNVTGCRDCPFYAAGHAHDGPLCRAAAFTNDAGANTACAADVALRTVDADVRSWCPLMREDVVVTRPR